MKVKPITILAVVLLVLGLLLSTSAAQETEVILDENDNVIEILNLEVYIVQTDATKLYDVKFKYGTAVNVFGDGETLRTIDFDFPSSNDTIFYARAAVNNALNSNETVPPGAGAQGTDDYYIPSIYANDLVVVAAGGENLAEVWSPCVDNCIDLDPDPGGPGQDPDINAGIALLSPVDNYTWADFIEKLAYVSTFEGCGGNDPCYQSIQDALNNEDSGTEIRITAEDYDEAASLSSSKNLILSGGWNSDYSDQSGQTTANSLTISDGSIVTEFIVINGP